MSAEIEAAVESDAAEARAAPSEEEVAPVVAGTQVMAAEDYICPICLEMLLRPVALSCGHRLCRGCWCRVLQSNDVRAKANRLGHISCPLGRCEVRPFVPEVDALLTSELEERFATQLNARAVEGTESEADEARTASEVNTWAAGGCELTART